VNRRRRITFRTSRSTGGDKRTRPGVPRRTGLAAACTAVHRPRFDRDVHSSRCGVKIAVERVEPSQSCSRDTAAAGRDHGAGLRSRAFSVCLPVHRAHGPRGQNRDEGGASARRRTEIDTAHQDLCIRNGSTVPSVNCAGAKWPTCRTTFRTSTARAKPTSCSPSPQAYEAATTIIRRGRRQTKRPLLFWPSGSAAS
jgi:hypothetical protein